MSFASAWTLSLSPTDIKTARQRLGLTQQGLAEALRLGPNGERTIRRWEQGDIPVTGPASVAIELMLSASPRSTP